MEGSQENTAVRSAAKAAAISLSRKMNNTNYFALDSITNVKTQVVAGTNFFLTIFVGETDCPVKISLKQGDHYLVLCLHLIILILLLKVL